MGQCFWKTACNAVLAIIGLCQSGSVVSEPIPWKFPWYASTPVNDWLSIGGEYVTQTGWFADPLLMDSFRAGSEQELKLGLGGRLAEAITVDVTFRAQQVFWQGGEESDPQLGVESATLNWLNRYGDGWLMLGRRYYEDSRGWRFHQSLDGLHGDISWLGGRLRYAIARQGRWKENWLSGEQADPARYAYFEFERPAFQSSFWRGHWSGYWLRCEAVDEPDKRHTLGLSASGPHYWLELAAQLGEESTHSVRAWAVDSGLILPLPGPGQPHFIMGWARGSGDSDADDQREQRFRQSGMQLNNGWLGEGGAKMKYYGQILEPELANLTIATLGMRFFPAPAWSLDILAHRYRQMYAAEQLAGYGPEREPNGESRDIGQALDVALVWRMAPGLKTELNLNRFWPGRAYPGARSVNSLYLDVRYHW